VYLLHLCSRLRETLLEFIQRRWPLIEITRWRGFRKINPGESAMLQAVNGVSNAGKKAMTISLFIINVLIVRGCIQVQDLAFGRFG
jgi:hypothetical protein